MTGRGRAGRRPPALRRCWLFLPGADRRALLDAAATGADVLIQELEDFTPPGRRAEARALAPEIYAAWRAAGVLAAVRVNPLETVGRDDLAAVMAGRPDIVLMSKVADPGQVAALAAEVAAQERRHGIAEGSTELAPNVESARGILHAHAIATADPRVTAVVGSTEDMAADLGAPRSRDGLELLHARQRLHLDCTAAGVLPVDCPWTFSDADGAGEDARFARRLGYIAKTAVDPGHVAAVNRAMTPSAGEVEQARALVAAFEAARAGGAERALRGGLMVEVPTYMAALGLLDRAAALGVDAG